MDNKTVKVNSPQFKKVFLILCIMYIVSFSSILRANFLYMDDLGRNLLGYRDFDYFSRYTALYGCTLFHTDTYMMDISPLPQLFAAVILAFSSTILLFVFQKEEAEISFWQILAVLPLGVSPYFLECISYKFDAPFMALSIFGMIFPLWFAKKGDKLYLPAVFLGTLMTCTTYQAGTGIFPMVVISYALSRWNQEEDTRAVLKFVLLSAAAYCAGLLFFRFVIFHPITEDTYVSESIFPASRLIPGCLSNLKTFYKLILRDFRPLWKVLIAVITVSYLVLQICQSRRGKSISLVVSLAAVLGMFGIIFGVYIALEKVIFSPRAMYGFGVLLAVMSIQCCGSSLLNKKYLVKIACCILSWSFIVFCATYGNAMKEQQRYTDFRIEMVLDDLADYEAMNSDETKIVKLSGGIGQSPIVRNMSYRYQMLNRLVPETFDGTGSDWANIYFFQYFGLKNVESDFSIDMESMDLPIIADTIYHTIRSDGTYILIDLKY